jgi:hypothetical protein
MLLSANLNDTGPTLQLAGQLAAGIRDPKSDRATRILLGVALANTAANLKASEPALELAQHLEREIRDPTIDPFTRGGLALAIPPLVANLKDSALAREFAQQLLRDVRDAKADHDERASLAPSITALSGNSDFAASFQGVAQMALSLVRAENRVGLEIPCETLARPARRSDLGIIVELLQWPQCASSKQTDGILRVAELKVFGSVNETQRHFGDLNGFLIWAGAQSKTGRPDLNLDKKPPNPFGMFWGNRPDW